MSLEGSDAPDFTLESTNGGETTLSETLEDGPTVVLVNRGHWYDILLAVNGEVSSRWGVSLTDPRRQLAGSYAPRWDGESVMTPTIRGCPT